MIVIPDNILVKGMINRQIMVSPGFFFFIETPFRLSRMPALLNFGVT